VTGDVEGKSKPTTTGEIERFQWGGGWGEGGWRGVGGGGGGGGGLGGGGSPRAIRPRQGKVQRASGLKKRQRDQKKGTPVVTVGGLESNFSGREFIIGDKSKKKFYLQKQEEERA